MSSKATKFDPKSVANLLNGVVEEPHVVPAPPALHAVPAASVPPTDEAPSLDEAPAVEAAPPARRRTRAAAEESVELAKRGRPAAAAKKEQAMFYLRPSTHERLNVGARIAGRPATAIVEELVEAWCERNAEAIDAALAVLDPAKLRTKISIS